MQNDQDGASPGQIGTIFKKEKQPVNLANEENYQKCVNILKRHKPNFDPLKNISEQTLES